MDVKTVIKSKGLTITEVASRMGITRVTLMQNLHRNPTHKTLQRIADAIGCEVADFYIEQPKSSVVGFIEIDNIIHKVSSIEEIKELIKKYD